MKKYILVLLLTCISVNNLSAETIEEKFSKANDLYKTKEYALALDKYLEIKNENTISSDLYYNIGNTYFRLSDYANSRLYFERALKLEPENKSIQNNLKVVKARLKGDTYMLSNFLLFDLWKSLYNSFMPKTWITLTISLFLLSGICFIIYYYAIDRKVLFFYTFLSLSLLSVLSFSLGISRQNYLNDNSYAIVFDDNVQGKDSIDSKIDSGLSFYKGQKVKIIDDLDAWYKLRLEDGKEVWGMKKHFVII